MDVIILLICAIGAAQSLFLGVYFLSRRDSPRLSSILLGLLFVALALRVSKSVIWAYFDETPLWFINAGFAAHLAVGPLFFLYLQSSLGISRFKKIKLLHFVPALLVLCFAFKLNLAGFWYQGGYSFLLFHLLIYLLVAGAYVIHLRIRKRIDKTHLEGFVWLRNLWAGIFAWGFAYFSNYFLGWNSYLAGPVLYSAIIYGISFYVLRHQNIFSKRIMHQKYKNLNLSQDNLFMYRQKLIENLEREHPYLKTDFNLRELSQRIQVPAHILSYVMNDELKTNFSELINSYRVRHAQTLLQDPSYSNLKIASISYECGFNSVSSFNKAFKKIMNVTPSDYKMMIRNNGKANSQGLIKSESIDHNC